MDTPGTPPKTDDSVADAPVTAADSSLAPPPSAGLERRRWHPWRIARNTVLTILALIVLAWLVLYITKGRFLKHPFERIVSGMTHRQVKVAGDFQLYLDWLPIHFVAEGLTISNPSWAHKPNLFEAKRIDTKIQTIPLIFGTRHVKWLNLLGGNADLEWNKDGQNTWTFSDAKSSGKPFEMPLIRRALLAGTTLHYSDPRMRISADLAFQNIKAADTQFESAIRFDGTARVLDTPFTLNGALLTPNATANGGKNKLELHAHATRTAIDVSGTLDAPTQLDGANLAVAARGSNLSELFSIIGVAVPDTRSYHLASSFTKMGNDYRFTGLHGTFGDSDLAGEVTVANITPRIKITATLATQSLDIVDVAPFIGYNPDEAAKGKAAVIKQVGGHPQILPDAPLRVDALKNFDADVHYNVRVIKGRNIPVSNVGLALTLDNSLLKLSPLTFVMSGGHFWSDIAINARGPVVHTDYDIKLSPTPMGKLLAGYGVDESGTSGVIEARIKMAGDGDTVHKSLASANGRMAIILPKGTFWTRNIQLAEIDVGTFIQKMFQHKLKEPVQINCGLIGFTVRDGVAAADPILIDTQKNVMLGRGGFSFKTEALDLSFRADAKKFSLFSGQSPVGINGYFAKPGIDVISPQLIERAGAAVALGVVATPVASVLAFVDVGDAKAAACGPVLAGATAVHQETTRGKPRDDVGHGTTAKEKNGKTSPGERQEQRKKFLGVL
jgi:AsmA family protein